VFYALVGFSAEEDPPPMYFLQDGSPDYFPDELKDQHLKSELLRPHWDKSLTSQLVWFDVFATRFYNTIPKDSPIAPLVRDMPHDVLEETLKTCAFRTLSKKWKNLKKTPAQIEVTKRLARRSQHKINVSTRCI
jgi:hypothetical protein